MSTDRLHRSEFPRQPARDRDGACWPGADGLTLIDPGPTSCLPALEAGPARSRPRAARRALAAADAHSSRSRGRGRHDRRARARRARLRARARRAAHDRSGEAAGQRDAAVRRSMDSLWGAFLPVPADRVDVLQGRRAARARRHRVARRLYAGPRQAPRQLSRRADRRWPMSATPAACVSAAIT